MKSKDMKYVGGGNVPFGKHEVPSLFGSQKTILFLSSSTTTSTTAVFYSVTTTVRHGERTEDGRKTEKKERTRSFMINKSQNGKRKKKRKDQTQKTRTATQRRLGLRGNPIIMTVVTTATV